MDFRNPFLRWGIGLLSGGIIAAIGFFFLEGDVQTIVYFIAFVDLVTTPYMLKYATQNG